MLDSVVEPAGGRTDEVVACVTYALPANVENASAHSGSSSVDLFGNALGNALAGNDAGNLLDVPTGNDTLMGGAGDDVLVGGDGDDRLPGGGGSDALLGGAGSDVFRFGVLPSGTDVDRLMDFGHGADGLEFAAAAFPALVASGDRTIALLGGDVHVVG